jgi:antitoxin (DNA-binding transcriptional repressor) of toxin-antitoxin stability system
MYTPPMQINASTFRRELFSVIERARQGEEVLLTHKGDRYRLIAEDSPSKLDRLTPMQVFNPDSSEADEERMKAETYTEWLKSWDELL